MILPEISRIRASVNGEIIGITYRRPKHIMKQKLNTIFEIMLYVICGICLIYFTIRGVYSKSFQAGLIIAVLLLFRGLIKWTKSDLPSALRFSVLLFIAITMLIANLFNMYAVIPFLDKWEHLLSGVILCFAGVYLIKSMMQRKGVTDLPASIIIWFALYFSVAMAGCWEIYEFTTDHIFGLASQNGSLNDTMIDIICGTIGAIGAVLYLAYKSKKHPL